MLIMSFFNGINEKIELENDNRVNFKLDMSVIELFFFFLKCFIALLPFGIAAFYLLSF